MHSCTRLPDLLSKMKRTVCLARGLYDRAVPRAVSDMQAKGTLPKEQKVEWVVNVDPGLKGGVVYSIGDVMVDASYKALQDQFFQSLESAGAYSPLPPLLPLAYPASPSAAQCSRVRTRSSVLLLTFL